MAFKISLSSNQRADLTTRSTQTYAEAIKVAHELVDEIATKERLGFWWRTEVTSVRIEEAGE